MVVILNLEVRQIEKYNSSYVVERLRFRIQTKTFSHISYPNGHFSVPKVQGPRPESSLPTVMSWPPRFSSKCHVYLGRLNNASRSRVIISTRSEKVSSRDENCSPDRYPLSKDYSAKPFRTDLSITCGPSVYSLIPSQQSLTLPPQVHTTFPLLYEYTLRKPPRSSDIIALINSPSF